MWPITIKTFMFFLISLLGISGTAVASPVSLSESNQCELLHGQVQSFVDELKPIYKELDGVALELAAQIKQWERTLTSWEGEPVKIGFGKFNFMNQAAVLMDESAESIEEKSLLMEDTFLLIVEKVDSCRGELFEKAQEVEDILIDHAADSRGFISDVAGIVFRWHDKWKKFEGDTGGLITFPQGTFSEVGVMAEKVRLGHFYISENSRFVLSQLNDLLKSLSIKGVAVERIAP